MPSGVRQIGVALVLATTLCHRTAAQPRLRVKAKSELTLTTIARDPAGAGLAVAGQLVDDVGAPLPGRTVHVHLIDPHGMARQDVSDTTVTDEVGRFEHKFTDTGDSARVRATFYGEAHVDSAGTERTVALANLVLRFVAPLPDRIDLDDESLSVQVDATSTLPVADIAIRLTDEMGRTLAKGRPDPTGRWHAALPTSRLGEPGAGKLIAISDHGTNRDAVEVAVDVLRFRTSQVHLLHSTDENVSGLVGHVTDQSGHPLGNQVVTITFDGELAATRVTDDSGRFTLADDGSWPQGRVIVVAARHESGEPWWLGGASKPIEMHVREPPSPPWWLLGLFAAGSLSTWAWVHRTSTRSRKAVRRRALQNAHVQIELSPPSATPPTALGIGGQIVDSATLAPITGAHVNVRSASATTGTVTDQRGRFDLPSLPPGDQTLRFHAVGYEEVQAIVNIPHRGQWRDARIHLRNYRTAALSAYRRALPWLHRDNDIHVLTGDELRALHERRRPDQTQGAFGMFVRRFEALYYGRLAPTLAQVEELQKHADDLTGRVVDREADSFDAPRDASL